jgi:hypothetical protein
MNKALQPGNLLLHVNALLPAMHSGEQSPAIAIK